MIVQNIEGASGLVGGGQLYAISKPDGLTIGILPLSGMAVAEMLEFDAVKYDLDKYTYIGRVEVISRALFASKASGFKSIADMQKSTKPIRFGTMDPTSSSSVDAAFLAEAFGLKAKLIPGYKGSKEYMLALMAGRELDAASTSLGGYGEQVRKGELVLVAVAGKKRDPDFPAAPTALETPGLKPEDKKWLELLDGITEGGRTIAAPPGVPEERRLFLDKALMSSLKEPGLVEWARKVEYNVSPLSGKECKELVTKMMEIVPKSERPRIKEIITKKYF
jgi:tripartite-type tricarboxylate transporter receptor subunit TctC